MDLERFAAEMECNSERIRTLVEGVSDEQARWKPDTASWSILEVINHLYDEEKADFRVRLDFILNHPGEPWPPIDPQGWVVERQYNQRDPVESLSDFLAARKESLAWLQGLPSPRWDTTCEAPWGQITAGDMFASWVVHDLLHMRQLVELHWAYATTQAEPYKADYAGDW